MQKGRTMRFSEFVKNKDMGIDPEEGLAGFGYDGPYAYPNKPEQGKDPFPYQNPDEPDSKTGQVWVARDTDGKKPGLADNSTKGMDKAVAELTKPDTSKIKETNPPKKWEKLPNKSPKEMPETKIKKKITNEEFVKASKEKNISEMVVMISEDKNELTPITDLYGNEFTPEPNQTIQYISGILTNSPRMMDRFVIEMKNREGFNKLLECMMQHQNCFDGIVDAFGKPEQGKKHSKQLAQAMHDKYVSALDSVDFTESVDAAPDKRFGVPSQPSKHHDMKLDLDDHPQGNGSVGGQGPVGGTMEPSNFGGQAMQNPTSGMPDFGQGPLAVKKKLMKAETAAGNLFNASAGFPHLRSEMEGACKNCMK